MTRIAIRPATTDDLTILTQLWREHIALISQTNPRYIPSLTIQEWQQQMTDWLIRDQCQILIACDEDDAVGYIIGWLQDTVPGLPFRSCGLITELVLDAHVYHGGAARSLVESLKEWFASHKVQHIFTYVPAYNATQQAFWRALSATDLVNIMWMPI